MTKKYENFNDIFADGTIALQQLEKTLGYDKVSLQNYILRENRTASICVVLTDDFQNRLSYLHEVQHRVQVFTLPLDISRLKNREQRELTVLAQQTSETKQIAAELQSAAGRRFASEIMTTREELSRMIAKAPDA